MRRHSLAIDCGILASLVFLNLLVIAPFLAMDFSSQPWNNDYTYIGMSRMFRDRPWSWNSLQYGGAPFHYLYPPLFHLLVTLLPVRSLGRAYHLVSGAGYALVPVAFYIAALQLFRSRRLAAALALLQSFSPTVLYYLLPALSGFAGNYRHGPMELRRSDRFERVRAHAFFGAGPAGAGGSVARPLDPGRALRSRGFPDELGRHHRSADGTDRRRRSAHAGLGLPASRAPGCERGWRRLRAGRLLDHPGLHPYDKIARLRRTAPHSALHALDRRYMDRTRRRGHASGGQPVAAHPVRPPRSC
jgi:hypothetical protein